MTSFEVLNDPTHVCALPNPALYPRGTDIQCREPRIGTAWNGICGRTYTRMASFWGGTPRWSDYDWGW